MPDRRVGHWLNPAGCLTVAVGLNCGVLVWLGWQAQLAGCPVQSVPVVVVTIIAWLIVLGAARKWHVGMMKCYRSFRQQAVELLRLSQKLGQEVIELTRAAEAAGVAEAKEAEEARATQHREEQLSQVLREEVNVREQELDSLPRGEQQYRMLFENSHDAVMTLAPPSWRFASANPAALRMFEAPDEAAFTAVGPWWVSPEFQPDGRPSGEKAKEMIETALRQGFHRFEWTHKRFGGQEFPAEVLLSRVECKGRRFLQATVWDVTDRKRVEQAIAAAHARSEAERAKLRAVIEGMDEGVVVADAHDVISDVNTWFLKKTGLRCEDIIGRSIWEFHPETESTTRLREVLGRFRRLESRETHIVHRQLLGMELMLRVQPVVKDDSYQGVVLNVIDITALTEARKAAEAASTAKSFFLANMSHEIRTPMTAILGYADIIKENCLGQCEFGRGELREAVTTIERNGEHLLSLINDILNLSKIESGNLSVERTQVSPHEILAHVASTMRPIAAEKGIEFHVSCTGAIPEVIQSDPVRLRQAILNLVGNAIKFTESGAVTVRVGLSGSRELPQLIIEVIDTGIGISAGQLETIFEPFKQADDSTTRRFGGTGLGLAISRQIARLLGGDLQVSSEPGKGSVFSLRVSTGSLDGVNLIDQPFAEAVCQRGNKEEDQRTPRLDGRILVVDDGTDNRRLIARILQQAGAQVETAADGREAVGRILAAKEAGAAYDVVLMDMQMPVMDGYEAARYLREKGYQGPVIALTAHAMTGDREKCLQSGCDAYVSKPIHRAELLHAIRQHWPKARETGIAGTASDAEVLVSELANDDDLADLIEQYVSELPGKIAAIEDAMRRGDLEALSVMSHQLKGSAGGYGFPAISRSAAEFEAGIKAGEDMSILRQRFDVLAGLCRRARVKSVLSVT
ncbi:MAG: ATP-binding protein [Phycisphaerae bacterium]